MMPMTAARCRVAPGVLDGVYTGLVALDVLVRNSLCTMCISSG